VSSKRRAARRPRKIYTPLDEVELRAVDKFSFRNEIRDRSQAIRRLIKIGLLASKRNVEARR
jgi:hypothetical protein